MNFSKILLSRSAERKMNEKKNKKKAVGVKWSKLQREGEGRGWGGVEGFWLFQYKITQPPSP